jgi:uncharacterized protein YoxC
VISAILVGVLIPAITQYRATLRSWEKVVQDNETDIRLAIREVAQLSARLNKMGSSIEANAKHVDGFFQAFEGITDSVRKLSGTVRTASVFGAAVAPAVSAAIRAYTNNAAQAAARVDGEPQFVNEDGVPLVPVELREVSQREMKNGVVR